MTGVAAVAQGARRSDVLREFWSQQKAAGVPLHRRAVLVAIKALAVAGYARGREEGGRGGGDGGGAGVAVR